jgi:hypothetical protein
MQEALEDEQGDVPIEMHDVAIKQRQDKQTNKQPGASRRACLEKSSVERRPNLPK